MRTSDDFYRFFCVEFAIAEKSKIIDIVERTYYFQHSKHESAEIVKAIEDLQQFGVVKQVDAKKWKVIAYDLDEFE